MTNEKVRRIGFLGPVGTYTHKALEEMIKLNKWKNVKIVPFNTFEDGMLLLAKGLDDILLPFENSTDGGIVNVLRLLKDMPADLVVKGEFILPIEHYLLSIGNELDIIEIHSKKEIFLQCRKYLDKTEKENLYAEDSSANAAEKVSASNSVKIAAIGPKWLTEEFPNLKAIKMVSDEENNVTKFLLIGKGRVPATGRDKTSFVFAAPNEPGSMDKVLSIFGILGINKTKIESRPMPGKTWEYIFYVDIDGHVEEERVRLAFEVVKMLTSYLRIFGSYPKAK
ncbi:ACT domain-containing protein [Patescibacteria group bacterium]|nr:ACT domain-containing protein [Patescibacteria group bacterium]